MAEKKPEARVVSEVCSMCGLDWKRHGSKPTTETCIRLLASDLAAANERANRVPFSYPVPYPVYPRPYTYYPPIWTISSSSSAGGISSPQYVNTNSAMPALSTSVPRAICAN